MTIRLKAPEGATSVNFEGETYEVADGLVDVPLESLLHLLPHGYAVAGEEADVVKPKTTAKK